MRLILTIIASIFVLTNSYAQSPNGVELNRNLGLIPQPKHILSLNMDREYRLNNKSVIHYDSEAKRVAQYLADELSVPMGYQLDTREGRSKGGVNLLVDASLNGGVESYSLTCDKGGVTIVGTTARSIFWGVQTLRQLLPAEIYSKSKQANVEWSLPYVSIVDDPLFTRYRGLHVDISRHFRTVEELKEIVDMLAMYKLNTMHLHFTDDQGWRIESKLYPRLTTVASLGNYSNLASKTPNPTRYILTQEEVKEVIAYAKDRYVSIYPEIDIPGHMTAVIRAYPELVSPTDLRVGAERVIRIDEKGLEFCKNIIAEMNTLFNSPEFHVGFDEVNLGQKEPIYGDEELTEFATKIGSYMYDELKVQPIFWDDIFEHGLHNKNYLFHWWRIGIKSQLNGEIVSADTKLQALDQPYILSPASQVYFDMKHLDDEDGARWAKALNTAQVYMWDPFDDMANYDPSKRHLAQGIIAASWSEKIPTMEIFEERLYPRIAVFAEKCWAQTRTDDNTLGWEDYRDNILSKELERYDFLGVNYWSKDNPEKLKSLEAVKKNMYKK